MEDLERKVQAAGSRLKVIALSGASNLTGYRPDLKAISRLAEATGALLFVDAAQLAPHRPIDMARDGIGALAFSAHKLYAPFGVGALVLPRSVLNRAPVNPGGGSIDMITDRSIVWAPIDERHQSGTWNAAGIVALGASCETMSNAGWSAVLHHERALVAYSVERLSSVPGLTLRVPAECYLAEDRIGTFPFSFDGYHPFLLAAILEHEYGIEVRAGTICNHRLVRRWLAAGDAQQDDIECQIKAGNRLAPYGIVRASLGIQSTHEDLDRLCNALTSIRTHGPKLEYKPLPQHECYDVA
jgi:selenocysteine lyase/cysteine desulfurase